MRLSLNVVSSLLAVNEVSIGLASVDRLEVAQDVKDIKSGR